jgi:cell division protein FtsB
MSEMTSIISLPDRILKAALAWPELPAILTGDKIISYKMLAHGILSAQEQLMQLGLSNQQLLAIVSFFKEQNEDDKLFVKTTEETIFIYKLFKFDVHQ